jgi:hypothetical protein
VVEVPGGSNITGALVKHNRCAGQTLISVPSTVAGFEALAV